MAAKRLAVLLACTIVAFGSSAAAQQTPACPADLVTNGTINCPHTAVYQYCQDSWRKGCRTFSFGPDECNSPCTFDPNNPAYQPPTCPPDLVTNCYLDGRYYQCLDDWGCQKQSDGWIAGCKNQCLTTGQPNARQWGNRTLQVVNKCRHDVWVGAYAENVEPTWGPISPTPAIILPTLMGGASSFQLPSGQSLSLNARGRTSGRVWGRTGCTTGPDGQFQCKVGDCGSEVCQRSGDRGVTLFEWTFDKIVDGWDVSAVDGYTLPMHVTPVNGVVRKDSPCDDTQCTLSPADFNTYCAPEVQYTDTGAGVQPACLQPCTAFGIPELMGDSRYLQQLAVNLTKDGKPMRDLLCCSCGDTCGCQCGSANCNYGCTPNTPAGQPPNTVGVCRVQEWPLGTNGKAYNQAIKVACPTSYSWPFDDIAATRYCAAADYTITFCG